MLDTVSHADSEERLQASISTGTRSALLLDVYALLSVMGGKLYAVQRFIAVQKGGGACDHESVNKAEQAAEDLARLCNEIATVVNHALVNPDK